MTAPSMREALAAIADAFTRGKGTFALARLDVLEREVQKNPKPFALCAGATKAVQTKTGVIVTLSLDREQVEKLRAMCDDALKEDHAPVQ